MMSILPLKILANSASRKYQCGKYVSGNGIQLENVFFTVSLDKIIKIIKIIRLLTIKKVSSFAFAFSQHQSN